MRVAVIGGGPAGGAAALALARGGAQVDLYLLCSDGLTGMLSDADIRDRLASGQSLHEIARALITDSNARGGIDNVTVVLLSVEEDGASEEAEESEKASSS